MRKILATVATALVIALGVTIAPAQADLPPVPVDMNGTNFPECASTFSNPQYADYTWLQQEQRCGASFTGAERQFVNLLEFYVDDLLHGLELLDELRLVNQQTVVHQQHVIARKNAAIERLREKVRHLRHRG